MMSVRGLIDRIGTGKRRYDSVDSIVAHMRFLLNSRKGLSITVPNYGVVDFNDVVHTLPDAIRVIQQSIRNTILEHEPRLKNVSVRFLPSEDSLILRFEIVGRLAEDTKRVLRLHSCLKPGGLFTVE